MTIDSIKSKFSNMSLLFGKNTIESCKIAMDFLNFHSFTKTDIAYTKFIEEVNGIMLSNNDTSIEFYGFAMPDAEMISPIQEYMSKDGYLYIGGYTDKRANQGKWRGIAFAYLNTDKFNEIYIKLLPPNEEKFGFLCCGFAQLIDILAVKNYDELLEMVNL